MAIMPKQSVAFGVIFGVFLAVSLSVALPATPCRGADRVSAGPTITLDVQNEPLRSVLGKISKTTGWKITAPDKWMDKPITQTLYQVSMEEGLRFILRDAGVENLLLTYDENGKTITVYDTQIQQGQSVNSPPAQGIARPPVFSAIDQSDPMLKRPARDGGSGTSRGTARARSRKQAHSEEE
jgi:hypothetical protein